MSIAEYLRDIFPLKGVKQLVQGKKDWHERIGVKYLSPHLGVIEEKIGERYCIESIDVGIKPTVKEVYEKNNKLTKKLREKLIKAYQEKSESIAII